MLAITTVPDAATAVKIANALVAERLAACVHVLPAGLSIYRWNGVVERADEQTLLIKTSQARLRELSEAIKRLHPYELPELIVFAITDGSPDYLQWIADETAEPTP